MQIDEPGRDNQTLAVDAPRRAGNFELAHRHDSVPLIATVADGPFGVAAVINRAATKNEIAAIGSAAVRERARRRSGDMGEEVRGRRSEVRGRKSARTEYSARSTDV